VIDSKIVSSLDVFAVSSCCPSLTVTKGATNYPFAVVAISLPMRQLRRIRKELVAPL